MVLPSSSPSPRLSFEQFEQRREAACLITGAEVTLSELFFTYTSAVPLNSCYPGSPCTPGRIRLSWWEHRGLSGGCDPDAMPAWVFDKGMELRPVVNQGCPHLLWEVSFSDWTSQQPYTLVRVENFLSYSFYQAWLALYLPVILETELFYLTSTSCNLIFPKQVYQ